MDSKNILTANIHALVEALRISESRCLQLKREHAELSARNLSSYSLAGQTDHVHTRGDHGRERLAAVVCWDVGHNPVGRGHVLYDLLSQDYKTTLIGPNWSRFGQELWPPLRGSGIDATILKCNDLLDYYPQAVIEATRRKYDVIYVSKPRLPSLFLGFMMKQFSDCPLIIDIDDYELSFFAKKEPISFDELAENWRAALVEPYEELATRYCETLIPYADAITVSNAALRRKYGGLIVRHARDETMFDPRRHDRAAARAKLNIPDDEFVFAFIGTVRPHKGLLEIVAAIDELRRDDISLHVFGDIRDARFADRLKRHTNARVVVHPNCAFEELPAILIAADCVPLLQDPDSEISQFQIPAKLSDALSIGISVLTTDVPPLEDMRAFPGIEFAAPEDLKRSIEDLLAAREHSDVSAIRSTFLGEFSASVNRSRMSLAIREGRAEIKPIPKAFEDIRALMETSYTKLVREAVLANAETDTTGPVYRKNTTDIAFFWKQNDTMLYGRRSDMIAKYLLKTEKIGRILFFDAPISISRIRHLSRVASDERKSEAALVLRNTLARWKKGLDHGNLLQRSFIYREDGDRAFVGADELPELKDFPDFVAAQMRDAGFDPAKTVAWVCPISWDFDAVRRSIGFRGCIGDVIDDQRAWDHNPRYRAKLDASYRQTLAGLDFVFTNCEPVANAFSAYHPDIHIVPNGTERFEARYEPPPGLHADHTPVIGYVGNMRDRIDWDLIAAMVEARPNWSFRFAGSIGGSDVVDRLSRFGNVHFLGVVEYSRLPSFLNQIDVAIVPHLISPLTASMNPLKIYNYLAADLPVVSTPVSNVDDVKDFVHFARDPAEFVAAIERCLSSRDEVSLHARRAMMDGIRWESRVDTIMNIIDPLLCGPRTIEDHVDA